MNSLKCLTPDCDGEWDVTVYDAPWLVCVECASEMDSDVMYVRWKEDDYVGV